MVRLAWCFAMLAALAGSGFARVAAEESGSKAKTAQPLHERIDQLIEAAAIGPLAPRCSDADFIRRVYLDLTGVIPTAEQARAFLTDSSTDKRQRLIDELLASPAFVRHMTITLDVMFIERRADKTGLVKPWTAFLYSSIAAEKPLDELCRELIKSDGAEEASRPPARFWLNRDAEPNLMTRDIGRLLFGMDMQCCQCHDHPLIDDYYQRDYYGLFALVHRTSQFTDPKTKLVALTEKADGEASYKSVFTGDSSDKAQPQLPKGAVLFIEPTFAKGEEYAVKPDKTVRGVPKFSRRAALAEMISGSVEFRRNMANRLWALMLGRGIVHPFDFHYAGNPPSNPELLTLLADELAASGFKLKPLLREIALSRAYQRTCDAPRPDIVNFADIAARLERLSREKEARLAALEPLKNAVAKTKAELKAAREAETKLAVELPKLQQAVATARTAAEKAEAAAKTAAEAVGKARERADAVAEAAAKANEAVVKVPDDKVLADAAAKIAARASELAATAEAAAKDAAERTSQREAAAGSVVAAEAAVAKAAANRLSLDKFRAIEQADLTANHAILEATYVVKAIDSQMALAKSIGDYASLAKSDPAKAEAAWAALAERWTVNGQVAMLKPLTPEQLAASAMRASGTFEAQAASAVATIDKKPPDALKNASDADKPKMRAELIELRLLDQIDNTFAEFVKYYGGLPGQDFQATVNQALFVENGGTIDGWLKPSGANLVARLTELYETTRVSSGDEAAEVADEMYVSVFSRPPSDSEKRDVAKYLKDRSDRPVAIGEMAWALLSSSEFRFNH